MGPREMRNCKTRSGRRAGLAVSHAQNRIREAVNRNKQEKLTALLHHVTIDFLRAAFLALKKRAAAGVDAVTWEHYAEGLEGKLQDLHRRLHAGAYRALPARRTYIPKADAGRVYNYREQLIERLKAAAEEQK